MDFSNKNLFPLFELGGETVYVTQTLVSTWVVMGILILFAVFVRLRLKKFQAVPKGLQNVVESLIEMMHKFTFSTMGAGSEFFEGYFFGIFAFILLSNYTGMLFFNLFQLRPPTADLACTAALALLTFIMIHVTGLKRQKGKYFKSFFEPYPIFFPINVISALSTPISLAFRLFGNILGGMIIMGIVYELLPLALEFVLPAVFQAYFDVFAGALQAYIFTILSMTFIMQKADLDAA